MVLLDHLYHDVIPLDKNRMFVGLPWQYLGLDDWGKGACYFHTSFRKRFLLCVYKLFGLHQICHDAGAKFLTVFNWQFKPSREEYRYRFHPE